MGVGGDIRFSTVDYRILHSVHTMCIIIFQLLIIYGFSIFNIVAEEETFYGVTHAANRVFMQ